MSRIITHNYNNEFSVTSSLQESVEKKWCDSYLDLHSVAHVDGDDVATVHSGMEGRGGLWWSLDVTFRPGQVELARN